MHVACEQKKGKGCINCRTKLSKFWPKLYLELSQSCSRAGLDPILLAVSEHGLRVLPQTAVTFPLEVGQEAVETNDAENWHAKLCLHRLNGAQLRELTILTGALLPVKCNNNTSQNCSCGIKDALGFANGRACRDHVINKQAALPRDVSTNQQATLAMVFCFLPVVSKSYVNTMLCVQSRSHTCSKRDAFVSRTKNNIKVEAGSCYSCCV
mmetsp:Transcript_21540/g.37736  ORF Transcript_21540/g.37736 Transcript_21540/m.37736 type:complete len:210 (-) Transcript_21540:590-1219(-)